MRFLWTGASIRLNEIFNGLLERLQATLVLWVLNLP